MKETVGRKWEMWNGQQACICVNKVMADEQTHHVLERLEKSSSIIIGLETDQGSTSWGWAVLFNSVIIGDVNGIS